MTEDLVRGLRAHRVPALARAISLIENGQDGYETVLAAIHPDVGRAYRIGFTGPPGAGKSTLIERVVQGYRTRQMTVAVVAVDPTSPYSGGALLGDRIRMEQHTLDPGVYIRSMATRGTVGGLAATTREVCDVLDAFGFDRIVIETVGVGQSELAIAANADTAVLVLVPESGDGVQVLKAGVMEIADLYVVNKADREGADRLVQEVDVMLGLRTGQAFRHMKPGRPSESWDPPVLTTVASAGTGVDQLIDSLERHRAYLGESGEVESRRRARLAQHTRDVVDRALRTMVWRSGEGERILSEQLDDVMAGRVSPYEVAADIVAQLEKGTNHGR